MPSTIVSDFTLKMRHHCLQKSYMLIVTSRRAKKGRHGMQVFNPALGIQAMDLRKKNKKEEVEVRGEEQEEKPEEEQQEEEEES